MCTSENIVTFFLCLEPVERTYHLSKRAIIVGVFLFLQGHYSDSIAFQFFPHHLLVPVYTREAVEFVQKQHVEFVPSRCGSQGI